MLTSIVASIALLIAVLLLVWYRDAMRSARRRVTRMVWCPLRDRALSVTLQERWDGRRIDVEQCSAFSPPTAVSCGKGCLRITRRPQPAAVKGVPFFI